ARVTRSRRPPDAGAASVSCRAGAPCHRSRSRPAQRAQSRQSLHYQVNAMCDLMDELAQIVALIGKKQHEMCGNVAKGTHAKHSSYTGKITVSQNPPERTHRQR